MAAVPAYDVLENLYFPFRLYSEYKRGESVEALASKYSVGVLWVEERIEAARLSIETQVKIEPWSQHG